MKRYLRMLVIITLLVLFLSIFVSADMGPKPSVVLSLENIGNQPCYVTLLSKDKASGPFHVNDEPLDESSSMIAENVPEGLAVWQAFRNYWDVDGFHFLDYFAKVENHTYSWEYYPPEPFKVLLYFPQDDRFLVSEIGESYALHSYFDVTTQGDSLQLTPNYDYRWDAFSLGLRVFLTLLVEIVVALFFWRPLTRKMWIVLVCTNIATQLSLNIAMNLSPAPFYALLWLELAVLVVEGMVYGLFLPRCRNIHPSTGIWYAVVANIASFLAGLVLMLSTPGIF